MRTIKLKSRYSEADVERLARALLNGEIDDLGEDDVLDKAIEIAEKEGIEVQFEEETGRIFNVDLAYRLRFNRALDIRHKTPNAVSEPSDPKLKSVSCSQCGHKGFLREFQLSTGGRRCPVCKKEDT
jgi:ribosomal protein S14